MPIETIIGVISSLLTSSTPGDILKSRKQNKQLYHFFVNPFLDVLMEQDKNYFKELIKKIKKNKNLFLKILIYTVEEFADEMNAAKEYCIVFDTLRKSEFNRRFISNLMHHKEINIQVPESKLLTLMPVYIARCIEKINSELDRRELKNLTNNLLEKDPRDVKWSLSTFWLTEILKNLKEKDYKEKEITEKIIVLTQIIDTSFTWDEFQEACKNQQFSYLELLKNKYDAGLYVSRRNIEDEFKKFIASENNLFAIIGESGFGKTNIMVHLAKESTYPSLFYSGEFYRANEFLVENEIERFLLTELGGRSRFREMISSVLAREGINLVQKISQMSERKVLIFIDAINEFMNPAGVLESLTRTIIEYANKYPNLKFILSCRKTSWNILTGREKVALPVNRMYVPEKTETIFQNLHPLRLGIELKEFDDNELEEAYGRYKKKYKLDGGLSYNAEKVCKNPLLLKIISEIYKGESIPGDVEKINVFDRYWEIKIASGIPDKESLLFGIVQTMREEKLEELNILHLESQPYFRREAFDELKDEGVLVEYQYDYVKKVKFSYERFFEYTLARDLLNQQSIIFSGLKTFIQEAEEYGPLKRAFEYFISMPISFSRTKIFEALLKRGEDWHAFICDVISGLEVIEEKMFDILDEIVRNTPSGSLKVGFTLSSIGYQNPQKSLNILKRITKNYSLNKISKSLEIWFPLNAICQTAPEMIDEMEKWLKSGNLKLQRAAIYPLIHHMGEKESIEMISLIKDCKNHRNWSVRDALAYALSGMPDEFNDLCIELLNELVEDEEEVVRSSAAYSLGWKIKKSPTLINYLYKWMKSSSWKAMQAAAFCAQYVFETDPERILAILMELAEHGDPEINKGVIKALLERTYSKTIFETFPKKSLFLMKKIILKSNEELRKDIHYRLDISGLREIEFKKIADLIIEWSNHENWKLREMSVEILGFVHKDNSTAMDMLEKLAEDINLNVRKKVAEILDFCQENHQEELKIASILLEDNELKVKVTAVRSLQCLYRIKPDIYLKYLKEFLIEESTRIERLAIGSDLGYFSQENAEIFSIWEKWVKEGDYKIKETLIYPIVYLLIGEIKVKSCLHLLKRILDSREWSVRMTLTIFLAYLRNKKANIKRCVDLLNWSAKDKNFIVRRQAVKSLFSIVLQVKFYNDDIIDVIERLAKDNDWSVRQQVAYSIGLHFEDCKLTFLEKFPAVARRLLIQFSNDKDWCVRASTIYNIYCFENGNFDLFLELEKDKNQNVRKWAKICANQKPKITDALDFEFANQEYIRDFRKFTEEIEYHADLNSPEETVDLLKKLRKYYEMEVNELISKWGKSESSLLRDCFQKISESDKKAI